MGRLLNVFTASLLLAAIPAFSQARFDLTGPKIDIRVTRAGVTLPIAAVPNLQPGDQLWLHPDLPPTQSVHYLLIVSFLRGTTNPPPDTWFTRIETWQKKVREEGVLVTVPPDAQQALLFLAPETGGDFGTLRSAVKGRPGIFVRASQDLAEAGFEEARTEKYIASMKLVPPGDPKALQEHSDLLSRTLNLRPNPDCFKREFAQQYTCLTQTGNQTLLDDGHAESIVATLSNGPGSDLINQASYTKLAGAGDYSAYVGAIVDFARLLNGLHTAKYQYIPAIASPEEESLNLRLNTPPSFNNPKSVIVIALPAVAPAVTPPLRPVDPTHIACLLDPHLVLPIEGAPLVFSTAFAHALILHTETPATSGKPASTEDIPLTPDAFQGGLTIAAATPTRRELPSRHRRARLDAPAQKPATSPAPSTDATPGIRTGTIQGLWGFDHFTGPTVSLQQTPGTGWHIVTAPDTPANLIAGQPNHLQLAATGTACIRTISLEPGATKVDWKLAKEARARRHRPKSRDRRARRPHPQPPARRHPRLHPPRHPAVRPGLPRPARHPHLLRARQDRSPSPLRRRHHRHPHRHQPRPGPDPHIPPSKTSPSPRNARNRLQRPPPSPSPNPKTAKPLALKPGDKLSAEVHLNDGRTLAVSTTVLPPRPVVTLLSSRITPPAPSPIQLSSPADLPLGARLTFFLKSKTPFPRTEQIELANADESLHTTLSVAAGSLVLQDAHTVFATFDPLKTFGPSTFGPFLLRALDPRLRSRARHPRRLAPPRHHRPPPHPHQPRLPRRPRPPLPAHRLRPLPHRLHRPHPHRPRLHVRPRGLRRRHPLPPPSPPRKPNRHLLPPTPRRPRHPPPRHPRHRLRQPSPKTKSARHAAERFSPKIQLTLVILPQSGRTCFSSTRPNPTPSAAAPAAPGYGTARTRNKSPAQRPATRTAGSTSPAASPASTPAKSQSPESQSPA